MDIKIIVNKISESLLCAVSLLFSEEISIDMYVCINFGIIFNSIMCGWIAFSLLNKLFTIQYKQKDHKPHIYDLFILLLYHLQDNCFLCLYIQWTLTSQFWYPCSPGRMENLKNFTPGYLLMLLISLLCRD